MNKQKVPSLFMPLKALLRSEGRCHRRVTGASGSLCAVWRCFAENRELGSPRTEDAWGGGGGFISLIRAKAYKQKLCASRICFGRNPT